MKALNSLKLLTSAFLILFTSASLAQEYSAVLGVHQTTADSNSTGVSTDGKFNFKAGWGVGLDLAEGLKFRTGLIYSQRHFDTKVDATGAKTKIKYAYLDIPANFQYNVNEMVGFFGGLVVAINASDSISPAPNPSVDAENLVPLVDVGVNFLFSDMVGFDVYYERGLGEFADKLENFSTFGANFLVWF